MIFYVDTRGADDLPSLVAEARQQQCIIDGLCAQLEQAIETQILILGKIKLVEKLGTHEGFRIKNGWYDDETDTYQASWEKR